MYFAWSLHTHICHLFCFYVFITCLVLFVGHLVYEKSYYWKEKTLVVLHKLELTIIIKLSSGLF